VDTRVRDEAGRRALFTLAAQDLMLTLDQGWLKALWRPQGLMFFPGPFLEDRWRQTLDALTVVATSLDRA
jgi:hypothetical protein